MVIEMIENLFTELDTLIKSDKEGSNVPYILSKIDHLDEVLEKNYVEIQERRWGAIFESRILSLRNKMSDDTANGTGSVMGQYFPDRDQDEGFDLDEFFKD